MTHCQYEVGDQRRSRTMYFRGSRGSGRGVDGAKVGGVGAKGGTGWKISGLLFLGLMLIVE